MLGGQDFVTNAFCDAANPDAPKFVPSEWQQDPLDTLIEIAEYHYDETAFIPEPEGYGLDIYTLYEISTDPQYDTPDFKTLREDLKTFFDKNPFATTNCYSYAVNDKYNP